MPFRAKPIILIHFIGIFLQKWKVYSSLVLSIDIEKKHGRNWKYKEMFFISSGTPFKLYFVVVIMILTRLWPTSHVLNFWGYFYGLCYFRGELKLLKNIARPETRQNVSIWKRLYVIASTKVLHEWRAFQMIKEKNI